MISKAMKYVGLTTCALFASATMAQDPFGITVGQVTGQAGQTVEVPVSIFGNNDSRVVEFNVFFSDVTALSNFDDANCDSEAPAGIGGFCQYDGGGERYQYAMDAFGFPDGPEFPTIDPIGYLSITIDAGATAGDVINLTVEDVVVENAAPVNAVNGSIEVVDVPPEEVSELSVTPASIAFGTVDLGNMPQTDTITAENVGGSASSLTINSAAFMGDAEFSILTNGCAGTTLAQNETCDVVVEFDAAANGTYSGSVAFDSDADTNPSTNVEISGSADSVADLSVNPPFGPVNLGQGLPGSTVQAGGSISNNGSADGAVDCTLNGDAAITTTPSPLTGLSIPAGDSVDFTISCAIPDTAVEGDSFNATLECTGDNGFGGTHDISCGATERQPLAVPTMSKIGLGILALLMVMIGGLTVRFFRT